MTQTLGFKSKSFLMWRACIRCFKKIRKYYFKLYYFFF